MKRKRTLIGLGLEVGGDKGARASMCDSMQGIHKSMQDDVGSRASAIRGSSTSRSSSCYFQNY